MNRLDTEADKWETYENKYNNDEFNKNLTVAIKFSTKTNSIILVWSRISESNNYHSGPS